MASVTQAAPATHKVRTVPRLVLDNVSWRDFNRWLRLLNERPGLRISYDRGRLEIMTVSLGHENVSRLLGFMIMALADVFALPLGLGGSTTIKLKRFKKGLEPDECFWIANELAVRGKDKIDLRVDPRPDLALEIDITRSSVNRLGIYASLGVPEVWRYDGQQLSFLQLQPDAKYQAVATSITFAGLTPAEVLPFLGMRQQHASNEIVSQFRVWAQQRFGGGASKP